MFNNNINSETNRSMTITTTKEVNVLEFLEDLELL